MAVIDDFDELCLQRSSSARKLAIPGLSDQQGASHALTHMKPSLGQALRRHVPLDGHHWHEAKDLIDVDNNARRMLWQCLPWSAKVSSGQFAHTSISVG